MRRGVLVAFAILGLTACGKTSQETADVAAAAVASPYAETCLEMTAAQNWGEAARVCAMALTADPKDQKVRTALDSANAALGAVPKASDAVALPSGEAAGEAADDAAEKAKAGQPN
jgi:hypothetical protein